MSFFNEVWDGLQGGFLRKPLKKALGVSDLQLAGLTAAAVAAPYALPSLGAAGAGTAAGATAGTAGAGGSLTGGAASFAGTQAAAPVVNASVAYVPEAASATAETAGAEGGLLSTFSKYAQPASHTMNIATQARGLSQGQQMQAPPAQFAQGQGFGGLLNPTDQYDPRKRQQAQQMAVQGLLGNYGRNYG